MFRKAVTASALCALAVLVGLTVPAIAGTPKGGVDRVLADVYVHVQESGSMFAPFVVPGVAHIQVHAYDMNDTQYYQGQPAPTGDEGWVSCDPVGSPQCGRFPYDGARSSIWAVDFDPPSFDTSTGPVAFIHAGPYGQTDIVLRDGGTPGNGPTGVVEPYTGLARTKDSIVWTPEFPVSHFIFAGYLISGNVTINRY